MGRILKYALGIAAIIAAIPALAVNYPVVDTGQSVCYDATGPMACPGPGQAFYGQDAQYKGKKPTYRDNGDGTISDLTTGLMWEKKFSKTSWNAALLAAQASRTGGYNDWRVPTIKELYSLIDFSGATGTMRPGMAPTSVPHDARPYINSRVFDFEYPTAPRFIDAQYVTSTAYLGTTMGRDKSFFGVNFADGRIKAYPQNGGPGGRVWYARYVRGNPDYGKNDFQDNGNGTITDRATGLTWTKEDSGKGLDWAGALSFCQGLNVAGYKDWRLPNAKELHSIVDYNRAPDVTNSAALDPVFLISEIKDDAGKREWPYFWSSTSHLDGPRPGDFGIYIAFGRASGNVGGNMMGGMGGPGGPPSGGMRGPPPGGPMMGGGAQFGGPPNQMGRNNTGPMQLLDVHGAGAQRSSPKAGDESRLPKGAGPQGDVLRIYNYARCVRE